MIQYVRSRPVVTAKLSHISWSSTFNWIVSSFFFISSLNCQDVSDGISLRAIDDIWLLLLHTNGHFGWRTLAVLRSTTVNTPDDNQNELDKKERSASEKETYFLQNNIMKNRDKKFI